MTGEALHSLHAAMPASMLSTPTMTWLAEQTARSLASGKNGVSVYSTLCAGPSGSAMKWAAFRGACMLSRGVEARLSSRALRVDSCTLETLWRWEVARLIAGRADKSGILTDKVWEFGHRRFDRWVSRSIDAKVPYVYCFETAALHTFREAQRLGVPRVLEVSSAELGFVHQLFRSEMGRFPQLDTPYYRYSEKQLPKRQRARLMEWGLADLVVLHSQYCLESWKLAGADTSTATVIPLAAPPVRSRPVGRVDRPLRCLWAGTFGIRKGAHILLEAWKRRPKGVTLDVFGSVELNLEDDAELSDITFHGSVPQSSLLDAMGTADLLLFPTLSDAFGMVITEAMACGLPVLTTKCAGAAELLQHGESGFICDAGSVEGLVLALEEATQSRRNLQKVAACARSLASSWQWSDYRNRLREVCESVRR